MLHGFTFGQDGRQVNAYFPQVGDLLVDLGGIRADNRDMKQGTNGQRNADTIPAAAEPTPLIMLDQGCRTVAELAVAAAEEASFLDGVTIPGLLTFHALEALHQESKGLEHFACEVLDDVENIVNDAGYVAHSDGEAGVWVVWTREDFDAIYGKDGEA